MGIEFFEIPQGTPSVVTAPTGTGYCTASDVASMNKARIMGQGNNPTATDVQGYILFVAGQIDAVLTQKGYSVPVNTASNPEAEGILGWVNATGAWKMMEEASPNSPNVDRAARAFASAMEMLSDAKFTMDLPMNTPRAEPRGPWATFQPTGQVYDPMDSELSFNLSFNNPANPYFSRQQQF